MLAAWRLEGKVKMYSSNCPAVQPRDKKLGWLLRRDAKCFIGGTTSPLPRLAWISRLLAPVTSAIFCVFRSEDVYHVIHRRVDQTAVGQLKWCPHRGLGV